MLTILRPWNFRTSRCLLCLQRIPYKIQKAETCHWRSSRNGQVYKLSRGSNIWTTLGTLLYMSSFTTEKKCQCLLFKSEFLLLNPVIHACRRRLSPAHPVALAYRWRLFPAHPVAHASRYLYIGV